MTACSCFTVCTVLAVAAFALGGCQSDGPAVAASGPALADSVTQPASSPRATISSNEVSSDGATAQYTLDFEYRTPGDTGQVSKWHDGVQLLRIDGAWLIDDFMHRSDWQFTSQGSVKSMPTATADLCVER
jgi:hypothetical protein